MNKDSSDIEGLKRSPIIKYKPEDFQVIEEVSGELERFLEEAKDNNGEYCLFLLEKRNVDMRSAIKLLAKSYNVREKDISFSGNKDKKAVTKQYITIKGKHKGIEILKDKNEEDRYIKTRWIGNVARPLFLGAHDRNRFIICIRNLSNDFKLDSNFNFHCIPNYFHNQRFGKHKNNHLIGKNLVIGDYDKAWEMIHREYIDKIESNEKIAMKSISNSIDNIRKINRKFSELYVEAFQSYIFNNAFSNWIRRNFAYYDVDYAAGRLAFIDEKTDELIRSYYDEKVMLPGFGFELNNIIDKYIEDEMKKEGISPRDFIIRQIPWLSGEAIERDLFIGIDDVSFSIEDDDIFKGKKMLRLEFSLTKGSYATTVIAAVCREDPVEFDY
ncbi:MAG: tRNA pseudouridine13 synthase [Candidatus Woesearchaeota archaeon]|nr:tRNA pseudouridine13 synthase [Candidatus Woesearchaeota archaeon]